MKSKKPKSKKPKSKPKLWLCAAAAAVILAIAAPFAVNFAVTAYGKSRLLLEADAAKLENVDCILVLGAKVSGNSLSAILKDRVTTGIGLFESGVSPRMLLSGDHGQDDYDEVNAMKTFAVAAGVPSEAVFMDHAGFSTYESLYRARDVFGAKKVVIVTQEYHLYRALYIAKQLGIEAYGVSSDLRKYVNEQAYLVREVLARNKDFLLCIFKPKPTYLGQAVPLSGSGDVTNDQ